MAKKQPAKPLFAVKHDFYDSLDAFLQEAIMFQQAVNSALEFDAIQGPAAEILRERLTAFRATMFAEDGPEG